TRHPPAVLRTAAAIRCPSRGLPSWPVPPAGHPPVGRVQPVPAAAPTGRTGPGCRRALANPPPDPDGGPAVPPDPVPGRPRTPAGTQQSRHAGAVRGWRIRMMRLPWLTPVLAGLSATGPVRGGAVRLPSRV